MARATTKPAKAAKSMKPAPKAAPAKRHSAVDRIRYQIMWNRLLSVVEEQAQVLVRTGFSTSTREAGDISAGVFDLGGRMIAQAVTGTPGHINSMANAVRHFIRRFPVATMEEGDHYITNDPWIGTGHLHDFTVVSPVFRRGRIVALFACTTHVVDIGGLGLTPDGRQVYHEGLYLPIIKLVERGRLNEWLLDIVRANVREPVQVVGDIYGLIACNDIGAKRLLDMMGEFGLSSLDDLAEFVIGASHAAKVAAIRELPKGTWRNEMRIDGYEAPVDLRCAVTITDKEVIVDFDGTSPSSPFGINVPYCYTEAYTSFGVNCVIAPSIPNNAGSLEVVKVLAPPGCIVNALHPSAVAARGTIGHMLPDVVFGALHQAIPGRVPTEGSAGLWNVTLLSGRGRTDPAHPYAPGSRAFDVTMFHAGGAGARPNLDGLSATAYPSGLRNVPVEITETVVPIVVLQKEYRQDSGGAGRQRGGLGQIMRIKSLQDAPFAISARFDRVRNPARGRDGGGNAATGRLSLGNGTELRAKGVQTVPNGQTLIVEMPGGGGYGDPRERPAELVAADVANGMISVVVAAEKYGVVCDTDGVIDDAATAALREAAPGGG
ncbi:MAG: hydantoinase B/oxoprolinase family protein [Alphaproteobacteria bacterium]|nr:hydantoinase B/oxoprolinase family protein [Alphaproteobacteria bacterium]